MDIKRQTPTPTHYQPSDINLDGGAAENKQPEYAVIAARQPAFLLRLLQTLKRFHWRKVAGYRYGQKTHHQLSNQLHAGLMLIITGVVTTMFLAGTQAGIGVVEHYSATRVAEQTQTGTSTSWANVTGTANLGTSASTNGWVDSANLTAGEDYLVMVWGEHNTNNTSGRSGIRVTHGGTAFTPSQAIEETDQTNAGFKTPYFWFTVWTAVTNEDLEVQFYNDLNTHTGRVEDVTMVVVNAEDLLANGDLIYDLDTGGGTLDTTFTMKSSITWTPANNNDTWWVAGYVQHDTVDIDTDQHEARLDINSGTIRSAYSIEGEDTNDTPLYGLGWAQQFANSSQTVELELRESAANQEWDSSGLFALRLNAFESFGIYAEAGDGTPLTVNSTYVEQGGVDLQTVSGGNFIMAAGAIVDDNGGAVNSRIQLDEASVTDAVGGWQQNATDDTIPTSLADFDINNPASQKNVDFDAQRTSGTQAELQDRWLVAFSMELSGGTAGEKPKLAMDGYIFENDDSDTADGHSPLAGSEFSSGQTLDKIRQGERVNLRTHLRNFGGPLASTDELGLFYDKNGDNIWRHVGNRQHPPAQLVGNSCGDAGSADWTCSVIGQRTNFSTAGSTFGINPDTNSPVFTFGQVESQSGLWLAEYVGSGGVTCGENGSPEWDCTKITTLAASSISMSFNPANGNPYIIYMSNFSSGLWVAQYVGSGGSGCISTAWTCTLIDSTTDSSSLHTSIAFNPADNTPYVSYYDSNTALGVARYVGSGGSGCASTAWTCTVVDNTGTVGQYTSIAFNPADNTPYVSYHDSGNGSLRVTRFVGSGGSGCTSAAWTCTVVDNDTDNTGAYTSIVFNASNTPVVGYRDNTLGSVMLAEFVGSGGSGCGASGSSAWTCTVVDDHASDLFYQASLAINSSGTMFIGYYNYTDKAIMLAEYVGSGGSGCSSSAWNCVLVDDNSASHSTSSVVLQINPGDDLPYLGYLEYLSTSGPVKYKFARPASANSCGTSGSLVWSCMTLDNDNYLDTGQYTSTAFDPDDDIPHISYYNVTNGDLMLAEYVGSGGSGCGPGGSTAWSCTTVDSGQGNFGLYSSMGFDPSDGEPAIAYYYDKDSENGVKYAKYVGSGGSGCSSDAWDCVVLSSQTWPDYRAADYISLTFSPVDNSPWVVHDEAANYGGAVYLKRYVGSGGDCLDGEWVCTRVYANSSGEYGTSPSIGVDSNGNPYIAFYGLVTSSGLILATYVGGGAGTGCGTFGSSDWNCARISTMTYDSFDSVRVSSMVVDNSDKVYIAFTENVSSVHHARVAELVGGGTGNCVFNTDWNCTTVDTNGSNGTGAGPGRYPSLAVDSSDKVFLSHYNTNTGQLMLAEYVGSGGSGCGTGASAVWNCTAVDSSGRYTYGSMAINPANDNPYLSFYDSTATGLGAGEYVGSGGSGCASSAWNCMMVDNEDTSNTGEHSSLAIGLDNIPRVSYYDATKSALMMAVFVGRGGGGCSFEAGDAWNCVVVDNDPNTDTGQFSSITLGHGDKPLISYYDATNTALKVAEYVGSGGSGCGPNGSTAWRCYVADNDSGTDTGRYSDIVYNEQDDTYFVSYYDATNTSLRVAELVAERYELSIPVSLAADDGVNTDSGNFSASSNPGVGSDTVDIFHAWARFANVTVPGNGVIDSANLAGFTGSWMDGSIKSVIQAVDEDNHVAPTNDAQWDADRASLTTAAVEWNTGDFLTPPTPDISSVIQEIIDRGGWTSGNAIGIQINDNGTNPAIDQNTFFSDYEDGPADAFVLNINYSVLPGTGCGNGTDGSWNCVVVDNDSDDTGRFSSLVIKDEGNPAVAYYDLSATALMYAQYVGSGGSGCGAGGSGAWTCTTVDNDTDSTGWDPSLAVNIDGDPVIAYYDTTATSLVFATHVGSGGSGCGASGSGAWTCTVVDNDTDDTGSSVAMAINPAGQPVIAYYDATADALMYSTHVGSGGSGCGANGSGAWTCMVLDNDTDDTGINISLAFGQEGMPYISYRDATATSLMVAREDSDGSEISTAPTQQDANLSTISASHADMTSSTDTANRNSADCLEAGNWNDSQYGSAGSRPITALPNGTSIEQCTETMWTLDTSLAEPGATYRFTVASKDNWYNTKNSWRGLAEISQHPTLSVAGESESTYRYSKDVLHRYTSDTCGSVGAATWNCSVIDGNDTVGGTAAMGPSGELYAAYINSNVLKVAKYVGSGGTGCVSPAWRCTDIASDGSFIDVMGMAFDAEGQPNVLYSKYSGSTILPLIAKYVGSGGTGCGATGSSEWSCSFVLNGGDFTQGGGNSGGALALSPNGVLYATFNAITPTNGGETQYNLVLAKYVGSGGTGCGTVTDWDCSFVHSTETGAIWTPAIAFTSHGAPVLAYDLGSLWYAKFVGMGGTNCGTDGDQWSCEPIDNVGGSSYNFGGSPSIVMSAADDPFISHSGTTTGFNQQVKVSSYSHTTQEWTNTTIDTTGTGSTKLAIAADGLPYFTYTDTTSSNLRVNKYDGSSWSSTNVDDDATYTIQGGPYGMVIGASSVPYVFYRDSSSQLKVAQLKEVIQIPDADIDLAYDGRTGGMNGDLLFRLSHGTSPHSHDFANGCSGNADFYGYCGLHHQDGAYDSLEVTAGERPMYSMSTTFNSNNILPTATVYFKTGASPTTSNVNLQVYRFGSTNAWETIGSYTGAGCDVSNCSISGVPVNTPSDYFRFEDGKYYVYFRVYQAEDDAGFTFSLDSFTALQASQTLRSGQTFRDQNKDPLRW